MNLETNDAINYSAGIGKTGNGIVKGYLFAKVFMPDGSLKVAYTYDVDGTVIKSDSMSIPSENVQAMYDSVSSGLPDPDVDFNLYIETAFYKAFINEMVTTFDGLDNASQVSLIS